MTGSMTGKVAVITGGARGLGAAMAELFVAEGARVVIADLRADEGEALATRLGDSACFFRADVSRRDAVQALVDHAVARFGGLDAMCNNAGITDDSFGPLLEADFARFAAVMDTNVLGTMLGTQIAARHMAAHGGGAIVNTGSISAVLPGHGFFTYRAAKAAVINFTRTAAIELGPHLVRVNCICPGNIPTEMGTYAATQDVEDTQAARITAAIREVRMGWQPLKRQGTPRDVAEAALFLASDRAAQVTGQILSIDGGATAGAARSQIAEIMAARRAIEEE